MLSLYAKGYCRLVLFTQCHRDPVVGEKGVPCTHPGLCSCLWPRKALKMLCYHINLWVLLQVNMSGYTSAKHKADDRSLPAIVISSFAPGRRNWEHGNASHS